MGMALVASLGCREDTNARLVGQWSLTQMNMLSKTGARSTGPVGDLGSAVSHDDKSYVLRSTSYGTLSVERGKWLIDANDVVFDIVESTTHGALGSSFAQQCSWLTTSES